ncbi:MAG: hypothetical protein DWQ31_11950 [Planctomycetota bacterium]|nr:MAG: hypothetical protein DWQ31_11950 [Planctomycetota bacterium]
MVETVEATDRREVQTIDNLHFVMGQGSGLQGYETVVVREDGACSFLVKSYSMTPPQWRHVEFTVPSSTVADLKEHLLKLQFDSWKESYHARVDDGGQWFVKVRGKDITKSSYFNNHFPAAVIDLSAFVRDRILTTEVLELEGKEVSDYLAFWYEVTDGGIDYSNEKTGVSEDD